MSWKLLKNVVHSRNIGEDKEGKTKYIGTTVGCIMQDDNGRMILKLNYHPVEKDPILNLFDPKPKPVVEEQASL